MTLGEYVRLLLTESYPIDMSWLDEEGCVEYGIDKGWLEPGDAKLAAKPIQKRNLARITHEYLKKELGEADEEDWSAAAELKDLYDCHVCVNHVAQMYVKGIMDPAEEKVFGMKTPVSKEAAEETLQRLMFPGKRTPRKPAGKTAAVTFLSKEEALKLFAEMPEARMIDVRTADEFAAEHLPGAVNLPMAAVLKNPYSVADSTAAPIFFYCEEGYQSTIAANCAAEAGYQNIYSFAIKSEQA